MTAAEAEQSECRLLLFLCCNQKAIKWMTSGHTKIVVYYGLRTFLVKNPFSTLFSTVSFIGFRFDFLEASIYDEWKFREIRDTS